MLNKRVNVPLRTKAVLHHLGLAEDMRRRAVHRGDPRHDGERVARAFEKQGGRQVK